MGLVQIDAEMLHAMEMPAPHIAKGATELYFRISETKAGVGGTLKVKNFDMESHLLDVLGKPVKIEGFGKGWLLGFEDEPTTGFIIKAKRTKTGSTVTLEEWSAGSRFRYWTPAEARPLTVAVATWIERQAD